MRRQKVRKARMEPMTSRAGDAWMVEGSWNWGSKVWMGPRSVGLLSCERRDQTWWTRWWRSGQGFLRSRLQVDGCPAGSVLL
jgi:hypothetical protein